MPRTIDAILFDFGQTLVDSADGFLAAEKEAQARLMQDLEIARRDEFLEDYRRMRQEFQRRSDYSRRSLWQAVYERQGRRPDCNVLEEWEIAYWKRVKDWTRPFPETFRVLEQLENRYRLGLVTNTQGQKAAEKHRLAELPELERFFRVILVAGESGVPAKPHSEPFIQCLAQLGVAAHRAVFVGDDWHNDVCGARDAGLQPVWLKHHAVRRDWPDEKTTVPVMTSLEALLELETWLD
ncbi:MAG: HAD family hydrolase [Pirellulales bacterium]|nr:HAD family hydrolase [Pirellulales bacterium]